jgi:hypothetical protein
LKYLTIDFVVNPKNINIKEIKYKVVDVYGGYQRALKAK